LRFPTFKYQILLTELFASFKHSQTVNEQNVLPSQKGIKAKQGRGKLYCDMFMDLIWVVTVCSHATWYEEVISCAFHEA